jgi:transposase
MSQNDVKTSATMQPQEASPVQPHLRGLGMAIAKRLLPGGGMPERGQIVWRKRLARTALMPCSAALPPGLSGLEACGGAPSWAQRCRAPPHAVTLRAPQFVQPSMKSNQNDRRAAEGLGAAGTRPTRCFVPTPAVAPPDSHALHRVRERLRGAHMALVHAIHGLLHA